MVERQLPKLHTGVRFPSPAHSLVNERFITQECVAVDQTAPFSRIASREEEAKISADRQALSQQARVAASSSTNESAFISPRNKVAGVLLTLRPQRKIVGPRDP